MRASSVARGGWDPLLGVFQSSLDARTHVLVLAEEIGFVGCTGDRLRWGGRPVALWIKWRLSVDSWVLGEHVEGFRLSRGDLWREFAGGSISG